MFDLTTSMGDASFETLVSAADWLFEKQPVIAAVNGEPLDWEHDMDGAVELRNICNAIREAVKRSMEAAL